MSREVRLKGKNNRGTLGALLCTGPIAATVLVLCGMGKGVGYQRSSVRYRPMEAIEGPIAAGPVEPTWKSLGDHFTQPVWWREARIGVWLHWGSQSVGEDGDWYGKFLYMPHYAGKQFATVYADHLKQFGHPSKSGYKDILPLWHAENWNPNELMALYRLAGARYAIA